MYKHAALTASNRRMVSLEQMSTLKYNGDAGLWKIDFINKCREVYASGATMEHFMIQTAFASMEGNSTQVQAMMACDMNDDDCIGPGMNLEALANRYSMLLATMYSSRRDAIGHPQYNVEEGDADPADPDKKSTRPRGVTKWCETHKSSMHDTAECKYPPKEGDAE